MVDLAVLNVKSENEVLNLTEILSLLQLVADNVNGAGDGNNGELVRNSVNSLNIGITALNKCIDRLSALNQEYIHTECALRKAMGGECE